MKKFNINDFVKVKLTDRGKDIYYHQFDELNEWAVERGLPASKYLIPSYPEVDEEGYTKIQLWHFMRLYGRHLYNGCEVVIHENAIYFNERDLVEVG